MIKNLPTLLNKEKLQQSYESYYPVLQNVLSDIEQTLKKSITLASMPTYKTRVKSYNSYYRKVLRIRPDNLGKVDLPVITDLIGIRVICAFLEDLSNVEKQITNLFTIKEIEHKGADQTFKEFGYESIHILIEIPENLKINNKLPENLVCEIQIRTILQDAWAEVEHELVYKSEFSPFDLPLRRKLASMNASLSLSDIIFQEIRDYQNKLNKELDFRRNTFYDKADVISREKIETTTELEIKTPIEPITPQSPFIRGTIDDLILEAIHAHNTGDLDRAINIYSQIIESKPVPNNIILSVIHKHRGMAFFAKSDYTKALDDFSLSVGYDPQNFRSYYYKGIVCNVMNNDREAIRNFDISIEKNQYQSHVYYRRALSKFNLGDYSGAMADLDSANQLGLDDEDCKRLRASLVQKFDMGM